MHIGVALKNHPIEEPDNPEVKGESCGVSMPEGHKEAWEKCLASKVDIDHELPAYKDVDGVLVDFFTQYLDQGAA